MPDLDWMTDDDGDAISCFDCSNQAVSEFYGYCPACWKDLDESQRSALTNLVQIDTKTGLIIPVPAREPEVKVVRHLVKHIHVTRTHWLIKAWLAFLTGGYLVLLYRAGM